MMDCRHTTRAAVYDADECRQWCGAVQCRLWGSAQLVAWGEAPVPPGTAVGRKCRRRMGDGLPPYNEGSCV